MDDFGLNYCNQQDAQNCFNHLGKKYKYTVDWSGQNLCGIRFDWEYNKGQVDISMNNYVIDALKILQHKNNNPNILHMHIFE